MKGFQKFIVQPFLVGLTILAVLGSLFGGTFLLAEYFGNVVYWVVAIIVFAWFLGFAWMATRG